MNIANKFFYTVLAALLSVTMTACGENAGSEPIADYLQTDSSETAAASVFPLQSDTVDDEKISPPQYELNANQIFEGENGTVHYSYYLPENYDERIKYPLVMTMPGYNDMWFGEASAGSNLKWTGFTAWTKLDTEMIVVSAQLTDWYETSAKQAVELTEYFIGNFSVDTDRIYAAGYSAGGETMSRAVSMRPDPLCSLSSRSIAMGRYLRYYRRKRGRSLYLYGRRR